MKHKINSKKLDHLETRSCLLSETQLHGIFSDPTTTQFINPPFPSPSRINLFLCVWILSFIPTNPTIFKICYHQIWNDLQAFKKCFLEKSSQNTKSIQVWKSRRMCNSNWKILLRLMCKYTLMYILYCVSHSSDSVNLALVLGTLLFSLKPEYFCLYLRLTDLGFDYPN